MPTHTDFVRFLRLTAITIALGVIAAMSLVVMIDPYRLYRLVEIAGVNQVKPQPDRYQEEIKLSNARQLKANALIFGNSRAEYGLNPDYAGFAKAGLSGYNLALSGTKIATTRRDLAYLRSIGQTPDFVILGVDFLDYLVDASKPPIPTASPGSNPHDVSDIKWQFDVLFSLSSVADAVKTLRIQNDTEAETISPRGLNPLQEYKKFAREQGYYAIFQQRALEYAKTFSGKPHDLAYPATGSTPELDGLRATLAMIASDASEAHIVIYPYHAQILALFDQAGLWPAFEVWKKILLGEVSVANKSHPDATIRLWDFSAYGAAQCEVIPDKGDTKSVTKWYWEAGHFKQSLGDLMLARMLEQRTKQTAASTIGIQLNEQNFLENQARIRQEKTVCANAYPALFRQVEQLANKELKQK
ncbi:hypothetical protein LPB67_10130 [Undibacterium sp. Jales W-56]|uniref:hypothetical protein n=1 Tax=Undibacterium sp. Jales W-56 TaxID=2897325 RepID=UPI0021CF51F6|nr:hypothetical protein [Undibacterium sp. Jales W-56]MCU6434125.1 hypothetical protein [Undibacterium sp. Jales W-56]